MQRTIGLIGGMSWESTVVYYKEINEEVRRRHGQLRSADMVLRSVDFEPIVALQKADRWDDAAKYLSRIAVELTHAGAECILICTNTMHLVADAVAERIDVPLIHIVDETGWALQAANARKPLLLATRYTMEQGFYRDRLRRNFGIEAIVPDERGRTTVHDTIFEELCCGVISETSRQAYLEVIEQGRAQGADSVILGCTEIGLLIGPADTDLPVIDSTKVHALAAVDFADGVSSDPEAGEARRDARLDAVAAS
ncbi:aspartate/glutamate racemase family protein [Consotaella aegiceratis]|uniref:aspartate/glutamate racemase family protein n=1 Tax=Consotaella aegiceratis TaxID=3097961 RepID=UPI002F3F5C90